MVVAEVQVDLDVWGLDRPLSYSVPEKLEPRLRVGSIVRVPLRGRRVRGWVVGVHREEPAPDGTQEMIAVAGRGPVFDEVLLEVARDLARRCVHPLASFLRLFTPPNIGRAGEIPEVRTGEGPGGSRTLWRIGAADEPAERYAEVIGGALAAGGGAIVVIPEVREGSEVLSRLVAAYPAETAVVHSGLSDAERSKALWSVAAGERRIVLGGRAAVFAPPLPLGAVIVHQEHDRSLREQRAPYYDARDAAIRRAAAMGASVMLASRTPSLRTLHRCAGWEVVEPPRLEERGVWPAVEILSPPRTGMPRRAVAAILEARRKSERTLILLPRARPTRAGPGPEQVAGFLRRVAPDARITRADRGDLGPRPGRLAGALSGDVIVATEAALAEVERPRVSTAIALGVDSFLQRPAGRGVEEAFATLWGLGVLVAGRARGRLLLETSAPDHYAIQALTRGDYHYFARRELEVRERDGSPPFRGLIRVQSVAEEVSASVLGRLRELPDSQVLGPAEGRLGPEVLLRTADLEAVLDPLRVIVSSASERLLVEVEPRDW